MISPEDISRVTDDIQFRRYIGGLVQAEKRRLKAGGAAEILTKDNTADDGVDGFARLDLTGVASSSPLFPHSDCLFQLKLNVKPEPMRASLDKVGAKERVGNHLKKGGHYVVLLGASLTPPQDENRRKAVLEGLGLDDSYLPQIHVLSAAALCAATRDHLDLYITLGLVDLTEAETFDQWHSRATRTFQTPFESDEATAHAEAAVQATISGGSPLLHFCGASGSGKSRTVCESVGATGFSPVVYFAGPNQLVDSKLLPWLRREPKRSALIVVEGCDAAAVQEISNRIGASAARVIAIGETPKQIPGVPRFAWKGPTKDALARMVGKRCPKLSEQEHKWVVDVCGRNPLMALQLGVKLHDTPPKERHKVLSMDEEDRALLLLPHGTKELAMHLAVFDRLGYGGDSAIEFEDLCHQLSFAAHQAKTIIEEQFRERELVQGQKYISLRPLVLRVQLLRHFLRIHGRTPEDLARTITKLRNGMPNTPVDERIMGGIALAIVASGSPQLADAVVGANGLFATIEDLEERALTFRLRSLAEGAPGQVLEMLERLLGNADVTTLARLKEGRRGVVPALETIATDTDLFSRAARLLAKLAAHENEAWSNNATGAFAELFSPAISYMAPTNAPGMKRIQLLEELATDSRNGPLIAKALGKLFSTHHVRSVSNDPTSRDNLPGWTPKTWGEVFDFIGAGWALATKLAPTQPEVLATATDHARQLYTAYSHLRPGLASWLRHQAIEEESVGALDAVTDILAYDAEALQGDAAPLSAILEDVMSTGLRGRLLRYVVISPVHDELKDRHAERIEDILEAIAVEAVEKATAEETVKFLLARKAIRGSRLAFHIGKHDLKSQWWSAMQGNNQYALSYLLGRRNVDEESFNAIVGTIASTHVTAHALALTLQGASDVGRLIASLAKAPEYAEGMRIWPAKLDNAAKSEAILWLCSHRNRKVQRLGLETAILYGVDKDNLVIASDAALTALGCPPDHDDDAGGRDVSLHLWVKLAMALVRSEPKSVNRLLDLVERNARHGGRYGDEELAGLVQACAVVDAGATKTRVEEWLTRRGMIGVVASLLEPNRRDMQSYPLDEPWLASVLKRLPGRQAVSVLNFIHLSWPGKDATAAEIEVSAVAALYAHFKDEPGIDSAMFNSLSRGGFGDPAEADRRLADSYLALASKIPSHPFADWLRREAKGRQRMALWWEEKREEEGWL